MAIRLAGFNDHEWFERTDYEWFDIVNIPIKDADGDLIEIREPVQDEDQISVRVTSPDGMVTDKVVRRDDYTVWSVLTDLAEASYGKIGPWGSTSSSDFDIEGDKAMFRPEWAPTRLDGFLSDSGW